MATSGTLASTTTTMTAPRTVRIVVVGDALSGKTSLITAFLKETFEAQVVRCLPEISIPAEITLDKVQTLIHDTMGPAVTDRGPPADSLLRDMARADVICLVYAVLQTQLFERLASYWLPLIRLHAPGIPVVLVGNKIDQRVGDDFASQEALDRFIIPLMGDYKEIETCIECSAKELINVAEVFYFASKAVLHPTAPLYDVSEHKLKPDAEAALGRIFQLCDKNKDGYLDDDELNAFQRKVFGSPLQMQELEGVKQVVREQLSEAGVAAKGLSKAGFIFLHSLFVQRGRLETIWTVLRSFGYDDSLHLRPDFVSPPFSVPMDCTTELNSIGYQFFADLFQVFDKDKDGALNSKELESLFSTSPGNPWKDFDLSGSCVTDDYGSITLQGFLAMWSMTTLFQVETTLSYLAYLGFEGDKTEAIKVLKRRKSDKKTPKTGRNVFVAYIFGATGCGKTEILRGLVGKSFESRYQHTDSIQSVVNSVEMRGSEKYLVLREIGPDHVREVLEDPKGLTTCDVACFAFDLGDPNSFSYLLNLKKKYRVFDTFPTVFVGTKADSGEVQQISEKQPDDYCKILNLAAPLKISAKLRDSNFVDLYNILIGVALNPYVAIPENELNERYRAFMKNVWIASSVIGVVSIGTYAAYRYHLFRKFFKSDS